MNVIFRNALIIKLHFHSSFILRGLVKYIKKTLKLLLALVLLIQVSTVYALPAGVHLNLCIGTDGHFDFSTDLCAETFLFQQDQPLSSILISDGHHGDCLDVEVNHAPEDKLFSSPEDIRLAKTNIINNVPPSVLIKKLYSPSDKTTLPLPSFSNLNSNSLVSSQLSSLQTVVLLI